jgi:HAD superfamily hydrolase (TIGR01509 family)
MQGIRPDEIQAIFFDLDGTLIDTDDALVITLTRQLQSLAPVIPGLDPRRLARQLVMATEGPGNLLLTLLDTVGLDDEIFSLGERLHRLRGHRAVADFRPVPGVLKALPRLRELYRLAVVTTRGRRDAWAFLAEYGLSQLFTVVTTHESTFRLKPNPAPILFTARQFGLPPECCLMVGDTWVDVKAGISAGAHGAGVLCGFGEREELEEAGAEMIFENPTQLLHWCEGSSSASEPGFCATLPPGRDYDHAQSGLP